MRISYRGKMRIRHVGKHTHIMHGQRHVGNANVEKCAFYAWKNCAEYRWKKNRILCMGKRRLGMPTLTNAHFMRGKKCAEYTWEKNAYYAWANPQGGNAHLNKCAFYAWGKKSSIIGKHTWEWLKNVGKNAHIMHGQTHGGNAHS